jgi:hypothetical protein
MLKRAFILLILGLLQAGCGAEYGEGLWPFEVEKLSDVLRQGIERDKRELLQIEDIKVGDGPVAAWGRRLSADIEVRYADGTVVYRGPIFTYVGFIDITGIENDIHNKNRHDPNSHYLSSNHPGIQLGLNGMAVEGRRRITVDRSLVCMNLKMDADPRAACGLVDRNTVHKEKLIVEATLTESCIPVLFRAIYMNGNYLIKWPVRCRNSADPGLQPTAPIWHLY